MKKKALLKRLNKLTKLIDKTEPDVEPDTHLFSQHSIDHEKRVMMVQEERCSQREMVNIMEESNHIWTIRNKIHNGEWDVLPLVDNLETDRDDDQENDGSKSKTTDESDKQESIFVDPRILEVSNNLSKQFERNEFGAW